MSDGLMYYLYTDIPGAGRGWTLAVLAVSQHDARRYVDTHNGGGRYLGRMVNPGKNDAHCGAVTEQAELALKVTP